MRHHLWIASAFVSTACFLSNAAPSHADEREELKAKIAQLREESEELAKNGKPDQARQRKREAAENNGHPQQAAGADTQDELQGIAETCYTWQRLSQGWALRLAICTGVTHYVAG